MLGRIVLTGAALVILGASSALAESDAIPFWQPCDPQAAQSVQCAFQIVDGNGNEAVTEQTTEQSGVQFSLTYQNGDGNSAYTGQNGTNQVSTTTQIGNGNTAYTYQEGENQVSSTVQTGNGHWSAISSYGDGATASVVQN